MAYETTVTDAKRADTLRRHGLAAVRRAGPEYQAYSLLYAAFVIAPIAAGADKFFHYLVDWDAYLSPAFAQLAAGNAGWLMNVVGIVEIVAGLLVAFRPSVGGLVVAAWLWGIILNLMLIPGFYDIALRDLGLSLGALALSRLASGLGR
jgi:hypothetical protein